jgi:hypothetical protein
MLNQYRTTDESHGLYYFTIAESTTAEIFDGEKQNISTRLSMFAIVPYIQMRGVEGVRLQVAEIESRSLE